VPQPTAPPLAPLLILYEFKTVSYIFKNAGLYLISKIFIL
jgi:hypothetical protein